MSELIDRTFWKRLKLFVQNVQVNDQMSEEEQGYILRTAERNIEAQMEVNKISSNSVLAESCFCGDCGKELTMMTYGKYQCNNGGCKSNLR